MKKFSKFILAGILVGVLGIIACGDGDVTPQNIDTVEKTTGSIALESTGVFRRFWSDPPTLDPHLTSDTTSAGIVVEVFSGLVSINTDLEIIPDIAESWTVEDGKRYTFTIRDNAKFHNGKKITAQDFKWSIERAANPATASPVADVYLNDIIGAMDLIDGKADEISGIIVIEVNVFMFKF